MFDKLIKELNDLDGSSITVSLESDDKGYIDRQCPSEDCSFLFKVNEEDWKNKFNDESVFCPFCRHEAPADEWNTIEQAKHIELEIDAVINGKIHNAMRADAQKFNRKQPRNSFISISLSVEGGVKRTYTLPAEAVEPMQLEITCEQCNSHFAVIGSAYFCPNCGHNSVTQTFSDSLRKIRAKIDSIDIIKNQLSRELGKDETELTCRSLLETSISDGVVAFQKYCEGLYSDYGTAPFNAFQRLEQGSDLWQSVIHKGYNDWLTPNEFTDLNILYQKRHILTHNEGIVDERYLSNSGDSTYNLGQRIVILNKDIENLVCYLQKLSNGIKHSVVC